jgi:hypothetical protein
VTGKASRRAAPARDPRREGDPCAGSAAALICCINEIHRRRSRTRLRLAFACHSGGAHSSPSRIRLRSAGVGLGFSASRSISSRVLALLDPGLTDVFRRDPGTAHRPGHARQRLGAKRAPIGDLSHSVIRAAHCVQSRRLPLPHRPPDLPAQAHLTARLPGRNVARYEEVFS